LAAVLLVVLPEGPEYQMALEPPPDTIFRSETQVAGELEIASVRWDSRLTVSKGWPKRR